MRLLAVALLLAGCSHVTIDASSNTSTAGVAAAPGTSVTGGAASVHVESASLAAVIVAGMFMAAAIEDAREPRPFPSFSTFADWFRGAPRREMSPGRPVSERDCTRPLDELSGNLKCR